MKRFLTLAAFAALLGLPAGAACSTQGAPPIAQAFACADAGIAAAAPRASPTFTGVPAAPTAAVDTNTTQLATTAFVVGQAAAATSPMDGTATVGTSLRYARQDHVHPTDTSRAPLASPTFTGIPAAPTAAHRAMPLPLVAPPPPRVAHDIAYTDGSARPAEDGKDGPQATGAGVWARELGVYTATLVRPGGMGMLNTIMRAELAAIQVALSSGHGHRCIATDSLAAMYLIQRAVSNPDSLLDHLHAPTLSEIARLVRDGEGPVTMHKVKAHSGVIGNAAADAAAKRAAADPAAAGEGLWAPPPFEGRLWPAATTGDGEQRLLFDLRHAVQDHMTGVHRCGAARTTGVYVTGLRDLAQQVVAGSLGWVMGDSAITYPQRRTVLQARSGTLVTQKFLHRIKRAASPACPTCGCDDSIGHLLGGCMQAPAHAGAATNRHHHAVALIAEAVAQGERGAEIAFVDGDGDLGELRVARPIWVERGGLRDLARVAGSRPDMVICGGRGPGGPSAVTLVEVKYGRDWRQEERATKAREQHAALVTLIERKWPKAQVAVLPIVLGTSGAVYSAHTAAPLRELGLGKGEVDRLLRRLVRWACESAVRVVAAGRHARWAAGVG
jgi:ribonuclease HI